MVHQFKNNGYNMVLDVCSGSVHVVDDLVYDIIEIFQGRAKEEVVSAIASNGREYSFDESSSLSREEQIAEVSASIEISGILTFLKFYSRCENFIILTAAKSILHTLF